MALGFLCLVKVMLSCICLSNLVANGECCLEINNI